MMREILKPYFKEYELSNNVLQEGRDKAKVDLFGDPDENIQYAYAIAKAIEEMGHTVDSSSLINVKQWRLLMQ